MTPRPTLFRWRGIGPLLLLVLLLGIGWLLFGDRLVEETGEEVGTELLGAQVDLAGLRVRETAPAIELTGLAIANPFDPMRNLLETGAIALDLDPEALLEKKLVVHQLVVRDLRVGTTRRTPARPVPGDGFAPLLLRSLAEWRSQFDLPVLTLSTIDTVRQLALDPARLGTVQAARDLATAADSLRQGLLGEVSALDPRPVIDSARALAERLAGASPARLGLLGLRDAVAAVRRTLGQVDSLRARVDTLRRSGDRGLERLREGLDLLDHARQRDYDFARSLLDLPRFDAPHIGRALFGPVSIDRFQQAVYWARLAERYLPPGLRPRAVAGPRRLRRDGVTVQFPRARSHPTFLIEAGAVDVAFDLGGARHTFGAQVSGITSEPALLAAPATVALDGTVGGAHPMDVRVRALVDRVGAVSRDSVVAIVEGIPLPAIAVPGLPLRVDPGVGRTGFSFVRRGGEIVASWTLRADRASWSRDSAFAAGDDLLGRVVWEVVSRLERLEVTALLAGPIQRPDLSIRSNLDEAIAASLEALMGEQVARAEARLRSEVDAVIGTPLREARLRVDAYRDEVGPRLEELERELAEARAALEARLRALPLR